ncbi:MAG: ABC transporter ATP-binding protein [Acidimicrobiales bacterium]|nr:ABC transporter ATP-binding protein [Acidimicrobiales bacterium]
MTDHTTSARPALSLRDVSVAFPDGRTTRTILDHLDLDLHPGQLTVISGRSGSGKSTLLTIAGLLRRPDAGEVTIAGAATARMRNRARTSMRRNHIAFVYQSANLFPSLTAIEQLELVGHIHGEQPDVRRNRARKLLATVDLTDRADQLPHQLSGGERQRVGIARAIMARPSVLIADEPTASLDPERAKAVAELFATATREHGLATLVVAHDVVALDHADRHLHLDDGRLHVRVAT